MQGGWSRPMVERRTNGWGAHHDAPPGIGLSICRLPLWIEGLFTLDLAFAFCFADYLEMPQSLSVKKVATLAEG